MKPELQRIPFNKPYLTGKEIDYIKEAIHSHHLSGAGVFTQKCHQYFQQHYGFKMALLTTSGTHALEMTALLIDVQPGDEIIIPSFTFVSTANAFVLRGARIVFADSYANHPNMDAALLEPLITSRTKAIVVVHYAGVACDMDKIMSLAEKYGLFVIEDAAHAIDSYFKDRPLGSIGHLAAFSFHETKNIISGEGGMLVVNDERFAKRAEIIWEKGTNRSAFWRREVDKYTWVDVGSSYLPSEIIAAFLFAQLEKLKAIQARRLEIWENYRAGLIELNEHKLQLPEKPAYATNNAHMFYLICKSADDRDSLISHLASAKIQAVFHYLPLNDSPFYRASSQRSQDLPESRRFSNCLIRLPFFYELKPALQQRVILEILNFFS